LTITHVPVVLGIDGAVEHCGTETALCRESAASNTTT
jgi:hypothetical protein